MSAVVAVAVFLFLPSVFAGQFSQILGVQDQEETQDDNAIDTQPTPNVEDDPAPRMPVAEVDQPPAANPLSSFIPSTASDIDRYELAMQVHELVNEERHAAGLLRLDYDSELALIAEAHSKDMASRNYFEHVNPDGQDPSARAEAAGYDCLKDYGDYYTVGIAENLLQGWSYDSIRYVAGIAVYDWSTTEEVAKVAVEGWMGSKGHRENILTDSYDREGIGVAFGPDGEVYITENFC